MIEDEMSRPWTVDDGWPEIGASAKKCEEVKEPKLCEAAERPRDGHLTLASGHSTLETSSSPSPMSICGVESARGRTSALAWIQCIFYSSFYHCRLCLQKHNCITLHNAMYTFGCNAQPLSRSDRDLVQNLRIPHTANCQSCPKTDSRQPYLVEPSSRGHRPELTAPEQPDVSAPSLLYYGPMEAGQHYRMWRTQMTFLLI